MAVERPKPLTLMIDGPVTAALLTGMVAAFGAFLAEASAHFVKGRRVEWLVSNAKTGSLAIEMSPPEGSTEDQVRPARERFWSHWQLADEGLFDRLPAKIRPHGRKIHSARRKGVTFRVVQERLVKGSPATPTHDQDYVSWGSVRGEIQAMSVRDPSKASFDLCDSEHNTMVKCHWPTSAGTRIERAHELGGDLLVLVSVEGRVTRDRQTGRPKKIDPVAGIERIEPAGSDDWREAIGCCPAEKDSPPSEVRIRSMRDDA